MDWDRDERSFERFPLKSWLVMMGVALGGAICLLYAVIGEARAQDAPKCGPLGIVEKNLAETWKEARIGHGIVNDTTVLLFYSTADGKTFTIVSVNAQGIACLLSSGRDLDLNVIKPGRGV